jgi:hypothetical protein
MTSTNGKQPDVLPNEQLEEILVAQDSEGSSTDSDSSSDNEINVYALLDTVVNSDNRNSFGEICSITRVGETISKPVLTSKAM